MDKEIQSFLFIFIGQQYKKMVHLFMFLGIKRIFKLYFAIVIAKL